eukprot:scaffold292035_cov31-Attheya_sp.AAC.1
MVYARVGKWFFSTIESITTEQPYVEPATPIDCWRVIDLTGWLKAHHYHIVDSRQSYLPG